MRCIAIKEGQYGWGIVGIKPTWKELNASVDEKLQREHGGLWMMERSNLVFVNTTQAKRYKIDLDHIQNFEESEVNEKKLAEEMMQIDETW